MTELLKNFKNDFEINGFDSELIDSYQSAENNADMQFAVIKTQDGIVIWFDNEANYFEVINSPDEDLRVELFKQLDECEYQYGDKAEFYVALGLEYKAFECLSIADSEVDYSEQQTFKIWRAPHYSTGTCTNDCAGYVTEQETSEHIEFDSYQKALDYKNKMNEGTCYLQHGELERPDFFIVES